MLRGRKLPLSKRPAGQLTVQVPQLARRGGQILPPYGARAAR